MISGFSDTLNPNTTVSYFLLSTPERRPKAFRSWSPGTVYRSVSGSEHGTPCFFELTEDFWPGLKLGSQIYSISPKSIRSMTKWSLFWLSRLRIYCLTCHMQFSIATAMVRRDCLSIADSKLHSGSWVTFPLAHPPLVLYKGSIKLER